MSQKKHWDPEQNTVATGEQARDLSKVLCCEPVSMCWSVLREGSLTMVGYRHTGFMCAGQFVEMPYRRWRRATFRKGKR